MSNQLRKNNFISLVCYLIEIIGCLDHLRFFTNTIFNKYYLPWIIKWC